MKYTTKLLIIILSLFLVTFICCKKTKNNVEPQNPAPMDFTVDSLNYRVNDDGSTVTVTSHVSGKFAYGDLFIPETVSYDGKNYTITVVGDKAFDGCWGLSGNLSIPSTVTKIGENAFGYCQFTGGLDLPGNLTYIGDHAFAYCQWMRGALYIPDSVTYLGEGAFSGCMSFDGTLHISRNITSIKKGTFGWCQQLIGTLYIPNSVTEIGDWAFQGCYRFTSYLEIPEAVTYIGESAFSGCIGFSEVISLATEPPTLRRDAFPSDVYTTLTVPCNSTYQYQHSPWYLFFDTIIEDCDKN